MTIGHFCCRTKIFRFFCTSAQRGKGKVLPLSGAKVSNECFSLTFAHAVARPSTRTDRTVTNFCGRRTTGMRGCRMTLRRRTRSSEVCSPNRKHSSDRPRVACASGAILRPQYVVQLLGTAWCRNGGETRLPLELHPRRAFCWLESKRGCCGTDNRL